MDWYQILALVGLPSLISGGVVYLITNYKSRLKKNKDCDDILRQAVQAILRDRLLDEGEKFVKKGWVETSYKQNYDNMYNAYHSLGKNGVMCDTHNKVMLLPTVCQQKVYRKNKD